MTTARRLLVVEDAFIASGRGAVVMPRVTVDTPPAAPFQVRLKLPTGEERVVMATMVIAHIRGKLPPYGMYRLMELTPEEVPVGTEIWEA